MFITIIQGTCNLLGLNVLESYEKRLSDDYGKKKLQAYLKDGRYDFKGIYLPIVPDDCMYSLFNCVRDSLGIYLDHNNDYSPETVEKHDRRSSEGSYCYGLTDGEKCGSGVMINACDTVLDIGAWIGEFSAYAAKQGATVYAFEPNRSNITYLQKTVELNSADDNIHIVPLGVGDKNETLSFKQGKRNTDGSFNESEIENGAELLDVVRLDDWVKKQGIKVDFIKADIEGFERKMLIGATEILQTHQPKLAICTYHNPGDADVLKEIILKVNSRYTIIQKRMKLYAFVEC